MHFFEYIIDKYLITQGFKCTCLSVIAVETFAFYRLSSSSKLNEFKKPNRI